MKIILASNSPRRKELLEQAGIEFEVCPADIEEITDKTLPNEVVEDLSHMKAQAIFQKHPEEIILAADTVVAVDGEILGKPKDAADALNMLTKLSGRVHEVYTGVTIIKGDTTRNFSVCTKVKMFENSEKLLKDYIATGEPMDKAGAYGIQGKGAILIEGIEGDYNNVVGLPLAKVYRVLYNL